MKFYAWAPSTQPTDYGPHTFDCGFCVLPFAGPLQQRDKIHQVVGYGGTLRTDRLLIDSERLTVMVLGLAVAPTARLDCSQRLQCISEAWMGRPEAVLVNFERAPDQSIGLVELA